MKQTNFFLKFFTILILCTLCACLQQVVLEPEEQLPVEKTPQVDFETANFNKAEEMYETGAYEDALKMYSKYLSVSTQSEMKDKALMRIGSIYVLQGRFEDARKIYKQLADEHPKSPYALHSKIAIIDSYLKEKRYADVQSFGNATIATVPNQEQPRILLIVGDAQIGAGLIKEALDSYVKAYRLASPEEMQLVSDKVKSTIKQMSKDDIVAVYPNYKKLFPSSLLLFQLAQCHIQENKLDEASRDLAAFIREFPDDENVEYAKNQMTSITAGDIHDKYTIGCILPLTGSNGKIGNIALRGLEFAVYRFNSRQGSYQVKISVKDSASETETAIAAIEELVKEKVRAIIGPITLNIGESAALSAQAAGIPIITMISKDNITELGDYVFRNFITKDMQTEAITKYAIEKLKYKRFAIMYPDDAYGIAYMDTFWDSVVKKGGQVTSVEKYPPDLKDFSQVIEKVAGFYYTGPEKSGIKRKGKANVDFEALFIPDLPGTVCMIPSQLAFHDISGIKLLGTKLWHSQELIEKAGPYVQGAIMPDGFFAESESPKVKEFVAAFTATYGNKPDFLEAISYDTAMMLFELINKPEYTTWEQLKNALLALEQYDGVTGKMRFDQNGDTKKQMYLLTIKNNKFVEIGLQ